MTIFRLHVWVAGMWETSKQATSRALKNGRISTVSWMTILSNSPPQEVATNCGIHVERQEFPPGENPTIQKDGDAKQFYDMLSNYGTKPVSAQSFAVGAPKEVGFLFFFLAP